MNKKDLEERFHWWITCIPDKIDRIKLLNRGYNKIGYDVFTWGNNQRAEPANCFVGIPISNEELTKLNSLIWTYYVEIIKDDYDYFVELEYPYPSTDTEILCNPYLMNDYFLKSEFWADFIIEQLSKEQKWDFKNSRFHILKFKDIILENNTLYLIFYALDITTMNKIRTIKPCTKS